MAQFFISYARIDVVSAEQIIDVLRQRYGHANVWYDQELHNRGGEDWWEEILDAIGKADIFVYLLSKESVESPYCQAEFEEAQRLEKRLIFIQVRDRTPLPAIIASRQYADMSKDIGNAKTWTSLYNSIDHQISKIPKRRPRPLKPGRTPRPQQSESSQVRPTDAPAETTPKLEPITPDEVRDTATPPRPTWLRYVAIMAVVLMFGVLVIGVLIASSGGNSGDITPTHAESTIAQVDTQTPTDEPTPTNTPTPEPTLSEEELETRVAAQMVQILQEVQETQAAQETATAVVLTVNAQQTVYAQETHAAEETAIALSWTPTPTPDLRLTAEARLTETAIAAVTQAVIDSTATATLWTATPTNTTTPTATATPTNTLTATPTSTPDPLVQAAFTPVARNTAWTPIERDFNGVTMVLVPAGCFDMGTTPRNDQQPVHQQCFDHPFWIDKYEVTQGQFRRLGGTQANPPRYSGDNRPVESITWFEARDFCELRDSRLPTEAEWEYAALGPNNLIYPWGDTWNAANVVSNRSISQGTENVGSIPAGVSWVGALDMSGNVWEWTSSLYESYPYDGMDGREADTGSRTDVLRVLRGGSFINTSNDLRSADRNRLGPGYGYYFLGFRCARSYE